MAASLVSGAIALILEKYPRLQPDQVKRLLLKNTRKISLDLNDEGAGVINLEKIFTANNKGPRAQILRVDPLSEKPCLKACCLDSLEYLTPVNPYFLFLILILLILSSPGYLYRVNPYFLFLILILLILSFEPGLVFLC